MSDVQYRVRALRPDDLEPVIALDQLHSGEARRGFFEQRLAAAIDQPEAYVGLAVEHDGRVEGFVLAHLLDGEFGGDAPVAVLDALAVARGDGGFGTGTGLLDALVERISERGARELQTQADWRQPGLLGFFSHYGFSLSPHLVLERGTLVHDF